MAPSGKRARAAARRAREAATAVHVIPTPTAAEHRARVAAAADAAAATRDDDGSSDDEDGVTQQQQVPIGDGNAYCVSCYTTDPDAFSQRMLHKRGRHGDRVRRCRACVTTAEAAALEAARASSVAREGSSGLHPAEDCAAGGGEADTGEFRRITCASCGERLAAAGAFSKTQQQKGAGVARCTRCVNHGLFSKLGVRTVGEDD